ncbi:MAG: hypothetical protein JRF59_09095 [Deltaproteobacteria bacterium]|nr:hypothetical protein [Deltaproteobacteria bacterium]MBW1950412.1 hypothetical protein [Deltaproteobacteria bacterium]MBW2009407.1 hypothetical protein [Deltaproteobacteria bacterium]MBW2347983.1 hypothetical protein [Deltaproteobacteria bacterium]
MKTRPGNGGFFQYSSPPFSWGSSYEASSTSPIAPPELVTVVADNRRLETMERKIEALNKKIQEFEEIVQDAVQVIELRDLSEDEAKREIEEYFKAHHGEVIDPARLQEELGIDIELACEICDELETEGKIKEA